MRFISTFAASFERTKNLYQGYTKGIQKAGIACFSLEDASLQFRGEYRRHVFRQHEQIF